MRTIFLIPIILFLLNSCGTILDSTRIPGKWKLISVDYYYYNEDLDSYKKITGKNDATPDTTIPIFGSFFGTNFTNYIINFQTTTFEVKHNCVDKNSPGENDTINNNWFVDGTDNSLTLDIINPIPLSNNVWGKAFQIKNYWPLSNSTTLEITLIASDVNMPYFTIPLAGSNFQAVKMKGIFSKM